MRGQPTITALQDLNGLRTLLALFCTSSEVLLLWFWVSYDTDCLKNYAKKALSVFDNREMKRNHEMIEFNTYEKLDRRTEWLPVVVTLSMILRSFLVTWEVESPDKSPTLGNSFLRSLVFSFMFRGLLFRPLVFGI